MLVINELYCDGNQIQINESDIRSNWNLKHLDLQFYMKY